MSLGAAFAGLAGAGGQGGAFAPGGALQQLEEMQRKRAEQAGIANALKTYQSTPQSQPNAAVPGAGQPPGPMAPGMPGGGGAGAPSMPNKPPDIMQMMDLLGKSNLPPDQQFEALQSFGAFESPFAKMQNQLEMAHGKLQNQQDMLQERMQNMVLLQGMRDKTSGSNTDKRIGAEERGQDVAAEAAANKLEVAQAKEKELERHNDTMEWLRDDKQITQAHKDELEIKEKTRHNTAMEGIGQQRADTGDRATNSKIIQGEEGLKIKQQNADTSSDRAGTYKYATMQGLNLKGKDLDRKLAADQARIAQIKSKVSAENKKPFQAAEKEYGAAASQYQSLTRPGMTPAASPGDIDAAKQRMEAAAQRMEGLAGGNAGSGSSNAHPVTPEAVADLKQDSSPERRKQFDEVFGAGSAAKALGE